MTCLLVCICVIAIALAFAEAVNWIYQVRQMVADEHKEKRNYRETHKRKNISHHR